jgi:outer membrane protein OmpA-like peptidoglycan-associated protein
MSVALDEGVNVMTRLLPSLVLCAGFAVLTVGCATKSFVHEQLSATETRLTQRADIQETKLREESDRAAVSRQEVAVSRQEIGAADQRLGRLDMRVGQVGTLARDAKTRADLATEAAHDAEGRLVQRIAARNRYRLLETRSIYFHSGQADVLSGGISQLEDVAKALRADANAVAELQGFADPRGSDRYNYQLAHERVEAVIRYLVQHHNVELRQVRAVAMGKVALGAGEKTSKESLSRARRVDIRLLAPWSSWEDAQNQMDETAPAQTPTVTAPAPVESAQRTEAAPVVPPAQPAPAPVTTIVLNQPATPKITDIPPREASPPVVTVKPLADADGDEPGGDAVKTRLLEFLKSITPRDLGGTD